ncbi:MAG: bifunctional [glutamine synthetase] adenylyltransferase/[glutamine synthetase]-adenylyl-L-tyrosine phosphorylase [Geminicoccales bacterium]
MSGQSIHPPEHLPGPSDQALAERHLARWQMLNIEISDNIFGSSSATICRQLLTAVFGNSPFLTDAVFAEPTIIADFFDIGADETFAQLIADLDGDNTVLRAALMVRLRKARRCVALIAALADISGVWALEQVTLALSRFADVATEKALALALKELEAKGDLMLPETANPTSEAGLIVLGMGKLGAFELNYSSDIDLIVLFDLARFKPAGKDSAMALAVRATRTIVYVLEQRTRDGYVFRTDLRLRPHPPGQPLALSVDDAELYYERFGQNWERAAMIKARVIAGDKEAGERFLKNIGPFLWRKHLDYAAIRDIHAIKRQINSHRGHGSLRVQGHDLKVGRGGIREIEFFVQTQQLILGGRVPKLRLRSTIQALDALVEARWLAAGTAEDLKQAYRFLRALEHRLQMVQDKQTHQLPEDPEAFADIATFMGVNDSQSFEAVVRQRLETVERHYAALFESSLDLGGSGALVFTGTEDDPATLKTLEAMGFKRPAEIVEIVRNWHRGHIRATRTPTARELLTELMPELLRALGGQADPDTAFQRFAHFMQTLPAGVQLFSLFRANPRLLALVTDLMGIAPRLAGHLSQNVSLFDAMLAPNFLEPLGSPDDLERDFKEMIGEADDLQDVLDLTRRWTQAREFQIGMQILLGQSDGATASAPLTAMAEVVIRQLLPRVENWLANQHGRLKGGQFAVLALGKLGSSELSIGSDLDLIFVFDAKSEASSDGPLPLPAPTYFARLGQRLVSALTAKTAEGSLYEIDTRLRPSGNLGPVACSIESFERYQLENAKIWEHQALTRCRVVAGADELKASVDRIVAKALAKKRDVDQLAREVRAMRLRIFKEHGSADPWNLKHVQGGLVDVEFLAQYLQLRYAQDYPEILTPATIDVFERAAGRCIRLEDSRKLIQAVKLYRRLQAVLRLSLDKRIDLTKAPKGLQDALVHTASLDPEIAHPALDINALDEALSATQKAVGELFDAHCSEDPPSAKEGNKT